jgi:hypothetical protein
VTGDDKTFLNVVEVVGAASGGVFYMNKRHVMIWLDCALIETIVLCGIYGWKEQENFQEYSNINLM